MSLPSPQPPTPNGSARLRLHPSPHTASNAARNSIISSSAQGWSPLKISKRDSVTSPLKPSSSPRPDASPRRTSNSFKHVTKNSLVSKSPFKSPTTVQGQQAAGIYIEPTPKDSVIHERKPTHGARSLGDTPEKAAGSAVTPKAAIGLGITATRPRTSRSSSGGSAVNGTRKVSAERSKVTFPSLGGVERRVSGERRTSGSKENDSPNVRADKRVPRSSMGLKGLAKNEYVSKSPFLSSSKRIPSGEIRAGSSPSAGPSPKTVLPVAGDDVFGTPSPRRVSGGKRRASPSPKTLAGNSPSPTPSPPRGVNPLMISSAGPSPLGQPSTLGIRDRATPSRSSMTPSRRLRGPRDLSEMLNDSPSKPKTVTFQSVPDVKEFEPVSAEASADGSFEVEDHWEEEGNDNSLDDILASADLDGSLDSLSKLRITNPDVTSPPEEPSESGHGDESTTADFVNTLIEEGLFSPPQSQNPAFEDPVPFTFPLEGDDEEYDTAPALSTPSLGDSLRATPLLADVGFGEVPSVPERDPAGIPYGRTHHAERAAIAHAQAIRSPPVTQPDLPSQGSDKMLFNANAAQPSLYSTPFDNEPVRAHQAGPMPDPFITLQTATKILLPERSRSEVGVPLGRTSHHERVQAARMLATQSLGLGMPRSPAVNQDLTNLPSFPKDREPSEMEVLFDASFDAGTEVVTPKKPLQPPMPQQLDLPSPVASPVKQSEPKPAPRAQPAESSKGFSLPFIGITSPFFNQTATVPAPFPPSEDGSNISSDNDRPLTPPPVIGAKETKDESPHRIPSLDFEEISLHTIDSAPFQTARVASPTKRSGSDSSDNVVMTPSKRTFPTSTSAISNRSTPSKWTPSKSVSSTQSIPASISLASSKSATSNSEFGSTSAPATAGSTSTSTRVRQRLSREMLSEKINQRIMDESLSRRKSTPVLFGASDLAPPPPAQRPVSMAVPPTPSKDKALPPPPTSESIPMLKAHTTDTNTRKVSGNMAERPPVRPRSQTQSAHDVLRANERDGMIKEPRSALDKLIDIAPAGLKGSVSSTSEQGILAPVVSPGPRTSSVGQATQPVEVLPIIRTKSPTPSPIAQRKPRNVSEVSQRSEVSAGGTRRKGRRSMSTGDVEKDVDAVKAVRKTRGPQHRLTLGIDDDQQSILEAFRAETGNIGSDRGYKVKQKPTVRASYDHLGRSQAGDLNSGKAWRQLRRPSDMNEHAEEIRAMRSKEAITGKASGTIFVKVLGIENLAVPLPDQPTYFCVTLDNGIDYIKTPFSVLHEGAKVNQEFQLVEHDKFEFSLSLDIRRDPHILKLQHEDEHPTSAAAEPKSLRPPSSLGKTSSGFRGLFGSPRKARLGSSKDSASIRSTTPLPPAPSAKPSRETIVRYMTKSTNTVSTIGKTHVAFKPIAKQCEAKVLEIRYPMFAMFKSEGSAGSAGVQGRKQVAKVTLQIFRLPPLPGLSADELPNCIDHCLRGIRHHAWHECEYHEGVLTQEGGDCKNPKRRMFKLIGGNLVAINEVTKKQVASIDLRKATRVVDLNADDEPLSPPSAGNRSSSPASRMTMRLKDPDDVYGPRPRSFRVEFGDEEEDGITFWADKQEDKDVWMSTLIGLLGKIPSNPLWAEVLAQRTRDRIARRTPSSTSLAREAREAREKEDRRVSHAPSARPKSMVQLK